MMVGGDRGGPVSPAEGVAVGAGSTLAGARRANGVADGVVGVVGSSAVGLASVVGVGDVAGAGVGSG